MNEKKGFDYFKVWFNANRGRVLAAVVLTLTLVLSMFTNVRVSDVAGDVNKTLDGPLVAYLSEDTQATIDGLQARWDELAPTVAELEEILEVMDEVEAQGVTNFDQLSLRAKSTTPVLQVNQLSTGDIVDFQDSGSTVWQIADGGAITQVGATTHQGTFLVDGQTDAVQLTAQGYTTQTNSTFVVEQSDGINVFSVSNAGNLIVSGTLDLRGNASDGGGIFTFADNVLVDGQADAVQLAAQGYTTQTSSTFVVEQSDGTDVFTVSDAGNTVIAGTTDNQGNVSDSAGVWTLADNGIVDGQADAVQLTVQGYTTQTSSIFIVEQSDGTDVWNTNNAGQTSSANGAVSFIDDVIVDGQVDTDQLTVQGYTTQTNDLQVWEQSDGTDVATMSNAGLLDISGELNYGANDLSVLGYGSTGQQLVYGTSTFTTTTTAAHGLTTVTFAVCTLGQAADAAGEAPCTCTATVAGNTVTLEVWDDDFSTATAASSVVQWLVVGAP